MKHATLIPLFFRFAHSRTSMSLIRSPTGVSIQGLVTFHPLPAFTFIPTQAGFSGRDYDHAPGNILHLLGISRPIVFNWKTKTSLFCSSFHVPAAQQLDIDRKYHVCLLVSPWFHDSKSKMTSSNSQQPCNFSQVSFPTFSNDLPLPTNLLSSLLDEDFCLKVTEKIETLD